MKTYSGSLQKKGGRYYLVTSNCGCQRWTALKTGSLSVARSRASAIAPADPGNRVAWLEQLVRMGAQARMELARCRANREITWENLAECCGDMVDSDSSSSNRRSHRRWIALLRELAGTLSPGDAPGELERDAVDRITATLSARLLSAPRIVAYYRRVWTSLGLDVAVWSMKLQHERASPRREHYRRLSYDEVRSVYSCLLTDSDYLADMVLLGYSTGLRLSDVAELELSELSLPFLRVCPNKTRLSKPNPLKIPLTAEALSAVERLQKLAGVRGESYLFPEVCRKRPSRCVSRGFRMAGVKSVGCGRASFHSLRATYISMMDDAGVPPHVTDSITGHGGGGMHARYTQPSDEALLGSVNRAIRPLGES